MSERTDILTLCYHAVSPRWTARISITPAALESQVEYLARRGYKGVRFTEAVLGEVEGKCVAITFDDGYASTFRLARPILDRFGMAGTLFIPTDYLGGGPMSWPGIEQWIGTEHEQELLPMSWEQARELADAGWEIGSHTKSHPLLTEMPDERLQEELVGSRLICEQMLDRPCRSIAYPYAEQDARVVAAAARAGYATGTASREHLLEPSAHAWPRVGVYHEDSLRVFRLKASPLVRRIRRSGAMMALADAARRVIRREAN